jgi:peptidoglycan/xylan/chitin deacetylase (PgdA/CDA1 family)
MLSLGLHLRLIGHPSRAAGLERVLDYVTRHAGVWVTRRLDIARHWARVHPPGPDSTSEVIDRGSPPRTIA